MHDTRTRILGTGSYLPQRVLHNRDLERTLDTSDEWIRTRTAVVERRLAEKDQATSDLALAAARAALQQAGVGVDALDLVLMATITPDTACPSGACLLQARLGARRPSPSTWWQPWWQPGPHGRFRGALDVPRDPPCSMWETE